MSNLSSSRISGIISQLSNGIYEKEEHIALILLCALSGKSVFLYGPPGTAKSLIVRRVSNAFDNSVYFGQLMNRFTTPEDVFGPVSLTKLKEDKFERNTEGFLPKADFVFLDEIWKSSPAILNTLLTVINEKVFRNGNNEEKVPLKALIAASNEFPPEGQGLDAMYDRFIMRLVVNSVESVDNFRSLLNKKAGFEVEIKEKITEEEWNSFLEEVDNVAISDSVFNIILDIKHKLNDYNQTCENDKDKIYVSDRRWQNIVYLLKAATLLSDRKEILPIDCCLISNCIWTNESNIEVVENIVFNSIKNFLDKEYNIEKVLSDADNIINNFSDKLEEINTVSNDLANRYETVTLPNQEGLFIKVELKFLYSPIVTTTKKTTEFVYLKLEDILNGLNELSIFYDKSGFSFLFKDVLICKNLFNNRVQFYVSSSNPFFSILTPIIDLPEKVTANKEVKQVSKATSDVNKLCLEFRKHLDNVLNICENSYKQYSKDELSVFVSEKSKKKLLEICKDNMTKVKEKMISLDRLLS